MLIKGSLIKHNAFTKVAILFTTLLLLVFTIYLYFHFSPNHNYVEDIKWDEINANQIDAEIELIGSISNDILEEYRIAKKNNYSLARMNYNFEQKHYSKRDFYCYMKSTEDSLFRKIDNNTYSFSFGNRDNGEYTIIDMNKVIDQDLDGYADRIVKVICGKYGNFYSVSRKSKTGLLEFTKISSHSY
ncbi:MAG: hypothetical protein ACK5B3_04515 [Bacteroidota bacterium]|jgi:hypothetical protein